MKDMIYYTGSELKWSTEDVYLVASNMKMRIKTPEDAVDILVRALHDNEHIMAVINDEIADKIIEYYDEEEE